LRTHVKTPLSLITLQGKVCFSRYYLKPQRKEDKEKLEELNGAKSIVPLDYYLGIAGLPFKITPMAMLHIAYWAQNQLSFQRAEEALHNIRGMDLNDDTIRAVTNFVGSVVFANECKKAEESINKLENGQLRSSNDTEGTLYIQMDGAAINTRIQNETGSTWRENKLGEVFSTEDIHYWTDKKGKPRHCLTSRQYISYLGGVCEFKKHLFYCALRKGYGRFKKTIVLSDGAAWIRNVVEDLFPDAQHIIDYFHLCENVNTYAKHIFKMDEEKYKPWAKEICDKLRKGNCEQVVKILNSLKSNQTDNCPVNLLNYITNNVNHINYPEYEKNGYFIGSGAIESGNKIVLQDRLKRAGMRWNTETAQTLLTLRAKTESKLWTSDVEIPFLKHCLEISRKF